MRYEIVDDNGRCLKKGPWRTREEAIKIATTDKLSALVWYQATSDEWIHWKRCYNTNRLRRGR